MEYLHVDNVTAFAKTIVKGADLADLNTWREWIYECVLDLGHSDNEIEVCALFPTNSTAALPKGCRQIVEVALFDSANQQLRHQFRAGKYRIYEDSRLLPAATAGTPPNSTNVINNLTPVDISNDRYHLHLGTNGSQVATILLRYFGCPIDPATKMPLIREDDRMACALFIKMMEALRANDNQSAIATAEQRYWREADRRRAAKKAESMTYEKAKTLKIDLMNLLPLNNLSKF